MVVYPNEGHVFHKPDDARDYGLRKRQWFDQWFAKGNGLGGADGRKLNRSALPYRETGFES
jgi:hypothetical protein